MKQLRPDRLVFYTDAGLEVEYEPVSAIVMEDAERGIEQYYRENGEPLDPPTYTTEIAGGGTQTFPHDETTLETEEDKAAWAAYKDAKRRLAIEQAQVKSEMVFSALKIKLPDDDRWEKNLRKWHITVPDDPDEKLAFYVQREILKTPNDLITAMTAVISASMRGSMSEAQIEAASQTFRDSVQTSVVEAYQAPGAGEETGGDSAGQ